MASSYRAAPRTFALGLVLAALLPSAPANAQCELQRMIPADSSPEARFGAAVAIDGKRAAIAALQADRMGAVYVYEKTADGWVEGAKLSPSDGVSGDGFGLGLAIEGDTIVVGAMEAMGGGDNSGKAYVFEFVSGGWTETQILIPADSASDDWFGVSVSLSGEWLVIGARQDSSGAVNGGSAYVYRRTSNGWVEFDELLPPGLGNGDTYGHGIAVHGQTIAVGCSNWDGPFSNVGSVFMWEFDGASWIKTQRVRPVTPFAGSFFGLDLDLEGDRLLVGARGLNVPGMADVGAAYVFDRDANGWSETAQLSHGDPNALDELGNKVSLSGDRALVGCWLDDDVTSNAGAAYVFEYGAGAWTELVKLTPSVPQVSALFGHDLDIDGQNILVGSYRASVSGQQSGALYAFDPDGGPQQTLFCSAIANSTGQAAEIAVSGSQTLTADDMHFSASMLPATQTAILLYAAQEQSAVLWGDGNLCLSSPGSGLLRASSVQLSDANGDVAVPLIYDDLPAAGQIGAGSEWSFQWLYRDASGSSGFNLTSAVRLSFCL